eukprot:6125842-Pyramimonas_sp.AAC.1
MTNSHPKRSIRIRSIQPRRTLLVPAMDSARLRQLVLIRYQQRISGKANNITGMRRFTAAASDSHPKSSDSHPTSSNSHP